MEVSQARLDALRVIGQLASDKVSKLARQGDLNRIKQMVDNAPLNMMYADLDLKMRYMNPKAEATLKRLEAYLPVKAHQMIGQSIDMFHKNPEHQRRILGDARNLPRTATINVGPELFELNINAMIDQNGKYIGPMIAWEVVTEKVQTAKREAETATDIRAVNQLLLALGRCRSVREVITAALASVREAFGWSYGSFWEVNPEEQALKFAHDSGSVSEEFRRVTAEARFREGEGLNGQTWQSRDLVFVPDLGEMKTCSRAPVARRNGLKSGVCFPILLSNRVFGTMDFFTEEVITPSESRLDALRNVGRLVSSALERVDQQARIDQAKKDLENKVNQLMKVAKAASDEDLTVSVDVRGDDDMGRLGEALARMISRLEEHHQPGHRIGQPVRRGFAGRRRKRQLLERVGAEPGSHRGGDVGLHPAAFSFDRRDQPERRSRQHAGRQDIATRQAGRRIRRAGHRGDGPDQEVERAGQRHHSGHQRDRQPDQPAGPERGDRGGAGWRARPGLRRRRRRGSQAGRTLQRRRQGDHGAHQGIDPPRRRRRPALGKSRRVAGQDRSGRRGNRRQHRQDRSGHQGAESKSSTEVNKAIQSVSSLTETNASSSEELSASAEEFGAQATALKHVISGFKV